MWNICKFISVIFVTAGMCGSDDDTSLLSASSGNLWPLEASVKTSGYLSSQLDSGDTETIELTDVR